MIVENGLMSQIKITFCCIMCNGLIEGIIYTSEPDRWFTKEMQDSNAEITGMCKCCYELEKL